MLRSLSIRGYTILDDLELTLAPGFTVITGETGAGKSLLIDVLALLLGGRPAGNLVAAGARQADLSALFEFPPGHPALDWLRAEALDDDHVCLLRRVVPAEGSSRAWINGRAATMGQLKTLGEHMVDIHGQHEHQRLAEPAAQCAWLDAQLPQAVLAAVATHAAEWQAAHEAMAQLDNAAGNPRELEFLQFQLEELEAARPEDGRYTALEAEQERLARSDELTQAIQTAMAELDGDDPPGARTRLLRTVATLEQVAGIDPALAEIVSMLREASINIDEALAALDRHADGMETEPERLAAVERDLGRWHDLARKHRVRPETLHEVLLTLRARLEALDNAGAESQRLDNTQSQALVAWEQAAAALTDARREAADQLAGRINRHLAALGMAAARVEIQVEIKPDPAVSPHGRDRVDMLFSANPGQDLQPLRRIASGGELSRLSLATVTAARAPEAGHVRIFDEVDAGIGGETAHAVGQFLRQAADGGQALCVTHLAQVAALADHQFSVSKHSAGDSTVTQVVALEGDARRREIARMLGSSDSSGSLARADELLAGKR